MSLITSDESAFLTAYGAAASSLTFAELINGKDRVHALLDEQYIHPTLTYLFLIHSIRSGKYIYPFNWAFDLGDWQIGSTNSQINSRLPVFTWNLGDTISRYPGYQYLWIIAPDDSPFSLQTDQGFVGVIPDADETTFFFSTDLKISSLDYDLAGGSGAGTWQGAQGTWQGDAVTW